MNAAVETVTFLFKYLISNKQKHGTERILSVKPLKLT